jgi:hypothetical protein
MTPVTFFGWWQPPGAAAVTSGTTNAGRLSAALHLTASDVDHPADTASRTIEYDLLGPGDVTGLAAGAVVHTYPSPGAQNIEMDKAVSAGLAPPDCRGVIPSTSRRPRRSARGSSCWSARPRRSR